MSSRHTFSVGEWYHCYSRGIDKVKTFRVKADYERFLQLLYLSNSDTRIHRSDLSIYSTSDVLKIPKQRTLASIGAFSLMPNHFHLLVQETREGGITAFMQKLGTAYAMYFNIKYERTGGLFTKPFRSRHITDDRYLQYVIQYIHCNPAELFEPGWKNGLVQDMKRLETDLLQYPYGSLAAFADEKHLLRAILGAEVFDFETQASPRKMLAEAREYYDYDRASDGTVKASP